MKRSQQVLLVLSGAVASFSGGCDKTPLPSGISLEQEYTNNHYVASGGYYHAPYHSWYPLPYNNYQPNFGYYYGGAWHPTPEESATTQSRPSAAAVAKLAKAIGSHSSSTTHRHGFGRSWFPRSPGG